MTGADKHAHICGELNDLYKKKNADYGDSFHTTFMEEGYAMSRIRLSDKLERFKTLTKKFESDPYGHPDVSDESMRDTLIDLANYAIMTIMEMDGMGIEFGEAMNKVEDLARNYCIEDVLATEEIAGSICHYCNNCLHYEKSLYEYPCSDCDDYHSNWERRYDCPSCAYHDLDIDDEKCRNCIIRDQKGILLTKFTGWTDPKDISPKILK